MEVKSCVIDNLPFCIWFENGEFHVENARDKQLISIPLSFLCWVQKELEKLVSLSVEAYYQKSFQNKSGIIRLAKFRNSYGWFLACAVWPKKGGRFNIQFPAARNKKEKAVEPTPASQLQGIGSSKVAGRSYAEVTAGNGQKVSISHPFPSGAFHPQWIRKEKEVLTIDFESLWVVSRLFAQNSWKDIASTLENHFHSSISLNPLFADKALIQAGDIEALANFEFGDK